MKLLDLVHGVDPYKHQKIAFKLGKQHQHYGLLMEPGTGKTLVGIALVGYRHQHNRINRVLIVCPKAVTGVWEEEFKERATFPANITDLTLYPHEIKRSVVSDAKRFRGLSILLLNFESVDPIEDALRKWKPEMIIVDESHRIKGRGTNQTGAITRLGRKAQFRMLLTGTPIEESPLDIFAQYRFLDDSIFGRNWQDFQNRYARMGGFFRKEVKKWMNMREFHRKMYSIAYRITKDEALDLPPQVDQVIPVKLHPKASEVYRGLEEDFIAVLGDEEASADLVVTQMLRLQQLTGGFLPLVNSLTGETRIAEFPTNKLETLHDFLLGLPKTEKVVIFARFKPELDAICKMLDKLKRKYVTVRGGMKQRAKDVEVQFQTDPKTTVAVCQIRAGSLGLTFTAANIEIFYSTSFSGTDFKQAKERIYRIGQERKVTNYHLITQGTIDEDLYETLQNKRSLSQLIADTLRRVVKNVGKKQDRELQAKLEQLKVELENALPEDLEDEPEEEAPKPKKAKEKKQKTKSEASPETEPESEGEGQIITVKELASDLGLSPAQLRKKLRQLTSDGDIEHPKNGRWEWDSGSKQIKKIKRLLAD